jgi:hypothetical protein
MGEVSGQFHAPAFLTPVEKATGTHCVDPRTGLQNVEKGKFLTLQGLQLRPFDSPARSQSLYRLHYPSSLLLQLFILRLYSPIQALAVLQFKIKLEENMITLIYNSW